MCYPVIRVIFSTLPVFGIIPMAPPRWFFYSRATFGALTSTGGSFHRMEKITGNPGARCVPRPLNFRKCNGSSGPKNWFPYNCPWLGRYPLESSHPRGMWALTTVLKTNHIAWRRQWDPLLTASHPDSTATDGVLLAKLTKWQGFKVTCLEGIILRIQWKAPSHQFRPRNRPAWAPSLHAPSAWHQTADWPSDRHLTQKGPVIFSLLEIGAGFHGWITISYHVQQETQKWRIQQPYSQQSDRKDNHLGPKGSSCEARLHPGLGTSPFCIDLF